MPKLSALAPYLFAAVLVAGLGGVAYYQHVAIGTLSSTVESQKDDIQKAVDAAESAKNQYQQAQEGILSLGLSVADIKNGELLTKDRLRNLEGRGNVVAAKPGLVEKKVNVGSDKVLEELSCVTGYCKESK